MRFRFKPTKVTLCVVAFLHSCASSVSFGLTCINLSYNLDKPYTSQIMVTLVSIGIMIMCDSIKHSLLITPPQCIVPDTDTDIEEAKQDIIL